MVAMPEGVAYWRAPRHRRCHGAPPLAVGRHAARRAALQLRAAARRCRVRRRDRRCRPHRRVDRLLPRGEADPTLRIAVLERATVGFGASGRNGGWCSALLPDELVNRRSPPRTRRGATRCNERCTRPSTRSDVSSPPSRSTATTRRAGGSISPDRRRRSIASAPISPSTPSTVSAPTTTAGSTPTRRAGPAPPPMFAARCSHRIARCPSGAPDPRHRGRRGAARRPVLRAHRRRAHRAPPRRRPTAGSCAAMSSFGRPRRTPPSSPTITAT